MFSENEWRLTPLLSVMNRVIICLLVLPGLVSDFAAGSTHPNEESETSDQFLARCRKMATSDQRSEAIRLLQAYLAEHDNSDGRVLLGQALSWEGRYEDARSELRTVLATSKDHGDALPALINVELWSGHPEAALEIADAALRRRPQSPSLLLAKAKALRALQEVNQARDVVNRLLEVEPGNSEGLQMRDSLHEEGRKMESFVTQTAEWFNDGSKPWLETQFSLKRETRHGSVIARFSQADRFAMTSRQSEAEFYPRVRPGTYMYLGAGFSIDRQLYPRFRTGAEIFQSVGKGFELSGGMRSMSFDERVNIYTGSLGKYYGNWYVNVRSFVTPGDPGLSRSFQVQARRYFGSSGADYIGLRMGHGSSPVDVRGVQDIAILRLNSFGIDWYQRLTRQLTWSARAGVSREDRLYRSDLLRCFADFGFGWRF